MSYCKQPTITDEAFKNLRGIRYITIVGCHISASALSALRECPHTRVVIVDDEIGDNSDDGGGGGDASTDDSSDDDDDSSTSDDSSEDDDR